MVCPSCASTALNDGPKNSHAAFVKAVLFGCGGALLGLILYSAFGIITGMVIGYLSLAVGYIVGKAMMMGSKGLGGRRYQIVAVLLTYAAVSISAIPMTIALQAKEKKEQKQSLADEQRQLEKEFGQQPSTASPIQGAPTKADTTPNPSFAAALGYLFFLGLASPFLELKDSFQGIIGLVILFVGIRIAWRITAAKAPEIVGPFQNSPAS
jgi:hypothetical protein